MRSTCSPMYPAAIRLNKGGRYNRRGSSCELCGQFSVDEFLDGGDLDVVPRAERENEDRFVVECDATGNIAVQPRVNPDAPWCLTQLEDLVL